MGFYVAQFLTGLASASALFLVACGLSIIFGVTRIVNFAHGSFYMLGAYLCYSLITVLPAGIPGYWGAVVLAALVVGLLGALIEIGLLRRLYASAELFQLLATFGIVLVIQDLTLSLWGAEDRVGPRAPGLEGVVRIFGEPVPQYDLALILLGPLVLAGVWWLLNRTRWGTLVLAATEDREMAAALGINQTRLFTSVFFLGSLLAGLGGAVQIPRETVSLLMDMNIIAEAFVVVVIGGMGSIGGAFVAAVIIAELNAFGVLVFPQISMVLAFVVMAVVLVLRPHGLFGRIEVPADSALSRIPVWGRGRLAGRWLLTALAVVLLALPVVAGDYVLVLATEILIAALFASSLYFILGPGGMVSFGHAAYFGLGAYGAALLVSHLGVGMVWALPAAPLAALLGAALFGWFCVRLSGVYLAMLTLAAAQILWSSAVQWQALTGGDDGLLGIWPEGWLAGKTGYYYFTLLLSTSALLVMWRAIQAPFGLVLRGGRDNPMRCGAIGIDLRHHQWLAFMVSGAFAGLAGGLFVFSKGSVFPDELTIGRSVDALVMVLLGGIQSSAGPLTGALVLNLLEDFLSRFEYWRAMLGAIIILVVVVAPGGLSGAALRLYSRYRRSAVAENPDGSA